MSDSIVSSHRPTPHERWHLGDILLTHRAEGSIMDAADVDERYPAYFVGGRARRATCSGVAWFSGNYLAVVNLYGSNLRTYKFHPAAPSTQTSARIELLSEIAENMRLPESVVVSPDGKLVAVTHSVDGVSVFDMDPESARPIAASQRYPRTGDQPDRAFHGIAFSPNGRYLAWTNMNEPGYVEVVDTQTTSFDRTSILINTMSPHKPKSVAFSRDGAFAAIVMGATGASNRELSIRPAGRLLIHRFDQATGVLSPSPIAELVGEGDALLNATDMCTFLPDASADRYHVAVVDQAADTIFLYAFDHRVNELTLAGVFASGLSFPHDVDISADGNLVAITTYGDDSLTVGRLGGDSPIV